MFDSLFYRCQKLASCLGEEKGMWDHITMGPFYFQLPLLLCCLVDLDVDLFCLYQDNLHPEYTALYLLRKLSLSFPQPYETLLLNLVNSWNCLIELREILLKFSFLHQFLISNPLFKLWNKCLILLKTNVYLDLFSIAFQTNNLSLIGGENFESNVRRVMAHVLSQNVTLEYNWVGKGNKKALFGNKESDYRYPFWNFRSMVTVYKKKVEHRTLNSSFCLVSFESCINNIHQLDLRLVSCQFCNPGYYSMSWHVASSQSIGTQEITSS